jgi:hypothetical protein
MLSAIWCSNLSRGVMLGFKASAALAKHDEQASNTVTQRMVMPRSI